MSEPMSLQLLGPLQSKVMISVWERQSCLAKEVYEELKDTYKDDVKYTTVVSTLNALVKKGYCQKELSSPAHTFKPRLSLKEYQQFIVNEICDKFYCGQRENLQSDIENLKKA